MERDGTGQLSTIYTYGNQRINSESYNNLTGLYTYDGRGSVSAVIGTYGDFRASYWYDGLGNVKSQIHGYGAFGSGKKYYGYNAEQYNPVTGNQNLRARQVNIRRQRFLTEDTYIGTFTETLSINRYIYGNDNPLKFKDTSGNIALSEIIDTTNKVIIGVLDKDNSGNISIGEAVGATQKVVTNSFKTNLTDAVIKYTVDEMSKFEKTDINPNDKNYTRGEYSDSLPDYTDAINEMLERERRNYETVNVVANVVGGILDSQLMPTGIVTEAIKYGYFYTQEKSGGRLDIKEEDNWKKIFDITTTPYLGRNGDGGYFLYDDNVINASELGNIAYGYWGKSLGFSDETLYYGGGFARLKEDGMLNGNIFKKLITDKYYGDRPEDIVDIMKGIELYNKKHVLGCGGGGIR